jgi:hypothetical protein
VCNDPDPSKAKTLAFASLLVKQSINHLQPHTAGSISLRRNYFRVRSNTLFHPFQSRKHSTNWTAKARTLALVSNNQTIKSLHPPAGSPPTTGSISLRRNYVRLGSNSFSSTPITPPTERQQQQRTRHSRRLHTYFTVLYFTSHRPVPTPQTEPGHVPTWPIDSSERRQSLVLE